MKIENTEDFGKVVEYMLVIIGLSLLGVFFIYGDPKLLFKGTTKAISISIGVVCIITAIIAAVLFYFMHWDYRKSSRNDVERFLSTYTNKSDTDAQISKKIRDIAYGIDFPEKDKDIAMSLLKMYKKLNP